MTWTDDKLRAAYDEIEELRARLAELEAQRTVTIAETVLPPFGESFTAPTTWDEMLQWLRSHCVIVRRESWDRLRAADSADDAPQLTDADMDRGQWKIGGKPVDAETGKAAMRETLIRRRCYCSDGAFCVIESGQTLAAMFYCGRKSSKPNHQASDHR